MKHPWYSNFYIKSPIAKIGIAILAILFSIVLLDLPMGYRRAAHGGADEQLARTQH